MPRRSLIVAAWMFAAVASAPASAHAQRPCISAPGPPEGLDTRVEKANRATAATPFVPAVLTIRWKGPRADRVRPGDAPVTFLIEAGSQSSQSDIAVVEVAGAELSFATPMANGVYYIRVRAANECGAGRASSESRVRIENSVERGQPNPLVILNTTNATRERLGETAYVRVTGQVRNGWQAAPAAFVKVMATFEGSGGELGVTATAYANGTSRRLKRSGVITDTVLDPGGTGCFVIFAAFRGTNVTGLGLVATSEPVDTEPLRSRAELAALTHGPDQFGSLVVSGRVTNSGPQPTFANVVWVETRGVSGQVLDCHATPVRGAAFTQDGLLTTRSRLAPGETAEFRNATEAVAAEVRSFRPWVSWDEFDSPGTTLTPEYRRLRQQLVTLLEADDDARAPAEIAAAMTALRDEARSMEQRLGAPRR